MSQADASLIPHQPEEPVIVIDDEEEEPVIVIDDEEDEPVIVIDDEASSEEEEASSEEEEEEDPQPVKTLRAYAIDYFDNGLIGHLLWDLVQFFRVRTLTLENLKAYLRFNTQLDGAVDVDDPADDTAYFRQLSTLMRHCEDHGVSRHVIEQYLLPLLEEKEDISDEAPAKRLRRV